uniref:OSJNBa0074B10.1 protein n=1 Tax=Oryza sativa subsp. japonica TaxID=39947 RepID=Q7XS97_ORYSJ|nr:OSJNBa0074B10.1 [Oryza sativa Japonica Group]
MAGDEIGMAARREQLRPGTAGTTANGGCRSKDGGIPLVHGEDGFRRDFGAREPAAGLLLLLANPTRRLRGFHSRNYFGKRSNGEVGFGRRRRWQQDTGWPARLCPEVEEGNDNTRGSKLSWWKPRTRTSSWTTLEETTPPQDPAQTPPQARAPTPPQAPAPCPPAPFKSRTHQAPPPARTRATKKVKVDAAENKEPPYDCTQEELDAYMAAEVKRQLKPQSPEKKIPINPSAKKFFRSMSAPAKEAIKLTDYEQTLKKAYYGKDQLLKGAPIPKVEVRHKYELGKPLVKPEQLQFLPTQMYKFYQRYMEMSASGREMIGARIKSSDFLQGEDILWINFEDIYDLYQLDALDVSIFSAWILMEIQRARRRGVFDTGFIDPRKAYRVNVYDPMNKDKSTFDQVFELIDRAWYRFRHLVRGNWKEKLRRKFKFPVIHMRDNLTHKEFVVAVQEQLIGFINEQVLDPEGEFYYDGNTIHKPLAFEITTTMSKS